MKRQVLYSGSKRRPVESSQGSDRPAEPPRSEPMAEPDAAAARPKWPRLRAFAKRRAGTLRFLAGAACALLIAGVYLWGQPRPVELSQEHVDAAVLNTLENKMLPSRAAKAAESVRPALVRVRSFADPNDVKNPWRDKAKRPPRKPDADPAGKQKTAKEEGLPPGMEEMSVGSGVVIVDDGTILTNLHVVYGAQHLRVTFYDGSESEAALVSAHPENDLAVIRAKQIPDDLSAATLASASRLRPGDEVVAVGFPFGMGPSVSFGVVSGLDREFRSPEGERVLTRLIQFDAAANPGSSGGPLVTMQGDVVGIVTAILNPAKSGTFIGIGFAVTIGAAGRAVGMHPF
jgi:S1-C subfamily serine protease